MVQHADIDHTGITGVSGNVAADAIWNAAGDLAVGTGSDTAARLAIGATNGMALARVAGAVAWTSAVGILQAGLTRLTSGDLTTTSTSFTAATGVTATITTAARRCLVMFSGAATHSGTSPIAFDIDVDGSRIGQTFGLTTINASAAGFNQNVSFSVLTDVLTAASHTFTLHWRTTAGTATLYASTGVCPAILTVLETGLTT